MPSIVIMMECDLSNVRRSSIGSPSPHEAAVPLLMEDLDSCQTPRQVIGEIGRVVAVCLSLGVLARALVAIVGG